MAVILDKIPKMRCDRCGECCGPAACSPSEFAAVAEYAEDHGIEPVKQGITCPWYGEGVGCRVYPVRPFICRLFGHTPELRCKNGHNVSVSRGAEVRLSTRLPRRDDFRWMHECCYSCHEVMMLLEGYGRDVIGIPDAKIEVAVGRSRL